MSPKLNKRSLSLLLPAALLFSTSGCSESARLSADSQAVASQAAGEKSRLEGIRAEIEQANRAYHELRSKPSQGQADSAQASTEITTLTERKHALETELGALRTDLDVYLKKNS